MYAFEPDPDNRAKLEAYIASAGLVDSAEVIPCATYDRVTELKFDARGTMGSNISESGTIIIPTETIDRVALGQKVTFIKMDIEGAERNALLGAEQTIRKYKPKLAICAYHRPDDCIVLPDVIRSIYNGYRFYFRVHLPSIFDAVLYAVPPQE